jgi:hypothetical protein
LRVAWGWLFVNNLNHFWVHEILYKRIHCKRQFG